MLESELKNSLKKVHGDTTFLVAAHCKQDYFIVDSPGQIEVFTWSASGTILTDTLASMFPTILVYIVDTPRSMTPATFMSNMLYACSIMYRTKLPFVMLLNKTDVVDGQTLLSWMHDFDAFQLALQSSSFHSFSQEEPPFMHSFLQSMALVFDEFYSLIHPVLFSAATGQGAVDFFQACDVARTLYFNEYLPELQQRRKEREQSNQTKKVNELEKLVKELEIHEKLGD
ncbi:hypothetical protein HMI54_011614 [Coelomomyces lativittatus]|nr:hypothetical protein HMI54_011614 [Coelomomyces lativittatus]